MPLIQAITNPIGRGLTAVGTAARRAGRKLAYDAVEGSKRRQPAVARLRGEDKELTQHKRSQLATATRDLPRNLAIAEWAIRKHLDYVSTFSFQARTDSQTLNGELEELVDRWARPSHFDMARRHGLSPMMRLLEAMRTLDGDVFVLKLRGGVLGDLLRTLGVPRERPEDGRARADPSQHARITAAGRAVVR